LGEPYTELLGGDPLQAGFVLSDVGVAQGQATNWLKPSASNGRPNPITYSGFTVADVTLGGHAYPGAQVYFALKSNRARAVLYSDSGSSGYINRVGTAEVRITSGGKTVSAVFEPDQLYVYYDTTHGSIGFGSTAGGRGYPLSLTQNNIDNTDGSGLVENSSVGAATDIRTTPANAANYSAATATLVTNLKNATVLSAGASSCTGFDPTTSICSNFTPASLATSKGPFTISEPYTADDGVGSYTINWGMFWTRLGKVG
jgi:hypothetical protein